MKLSSIAYAACIALSATVADAATVVTEAKATTAAAAPGTSVVKMTITLDAAHAAVGDTLKVILPNSFDAILASTPVAAELTMSCDNGGADTSMVLATDYSAAYVASTRTLTLENLVIGKVCLVAQPVIVTFLKSTLRAVEIATDSVTVANSKVSGEADSSALAVGPASGTTRSLVTVLPGTLGEPDFADNNFVIDYTAAGDITADLVTVALYKYAFASGSVCTVGGTAPSGGTTVGTAAADYAFVTFTLTANQKFSTVKTAVNCTGVTRSTNETYAGGVQLWITDASTNVETANFKSTGYTTNSPTPQPTTAPPTPSSNSTNADADHSSALSLSSAPIILAALMVGLGSMNN